jgi:hypothetical protein
MRRTLEECADVLARLDRFSSFNVDVLSDEALVGFGPQTAAMRLHLAALYKERAASSELSDRIYQRIRRDPD